MTLKTDKSGALITPYKTHRIGDTDYILRGRCLIDGPSDERPGCRIQIKDEKGLKFDFEIDQNIGYPLTGDNLEVYTDLFLRQFAQDDEVAEWISPRRIVKKLKKRAEWRMDDCVDPAALD